MTHDPQPYSEADTRRRLIDNRLALAGWDVADPSQVVQELDIYVGGDSPGSVRERPALYAGHRFADYALLLGGKPVAVLEARQTSREGGDPDKLGRGAVWRGEIEGCIHQNHLFRVRLRDDGFVPDYVSALLGSSYGKRYFLRAAKQTTGIASINRTQLGGFPVVAAPSETQQRFFAAVLRVREFETRLLGAVTAADNLFDSLTQRAFRGNPSR